jgi:tetratricopeptide (TPR) repeat protein
MFQKVTLWSTYTLFFLLPLFFLPWTTSVLEHNKQLLLVVLSILALVAWLGEMVMTKRLSFRSGWLNILPGAFLLAVLISAATSFAGYQSWVGQAAQEYISFLSIAMYVVLFFTLMNNASGTQTQRNILFVVLLSAAISGLITLLGMFNLVHLPFDFTQSRGFNTVGTLNGLITFLTAVMFTGLAMWLVSQQGRDRVIPLGNLGMAMRVFIIIVTVVNLVALIAIDFSIFWIINIFGVLLLAAFGFIQSQEFPNPKRFALPLVVLLISVLFLFLPTPLRLQLPLSVSPSYGASWNITKAALGSNSGNMLFGTGPGTYGHDYLAFKPVSVNGSQFWSLRFDRAKSSFLTTFASFGIIGTSLWLALMVWIAAKAIGRLIFERDHEEWKMTYVIFVGWATLLSTNLLYSSNLTMEFMLWGFTGLLASQVMVKLWNTDFGRSPKLGLATSFAFVLVAVGVLASLFVTGQRYAAEVAFAKGVKADRDGAKMIEVIPQLERAVTYNGFSDIYHRNLAAAQLAQARVKIAEFRSGGTTELTTEQTQEVSTLVSSAINSATRATTLEPNFVANWSLRGSIYRDVMSFAQGAEDLASQMFINASRLEPNNPIHRVNLGRVYLTVADRARSLKNAEDKELAKTATEQEANLLKTAEQTFLSAIKLKNDYLPSHYYLAATYERQGRVEEAATRLAAIRNANQTDIGVAFQLSQLLIRLQRYDLATKELERIVGLNPDYSNGLWYLASMYEVGKKQSEAIKLVEKVVELNPNNEVAKKRLALMKAGKITTQIPEPIQEGQGEVTDVPEGEIVEEEADGTEEAEEAGE